MKKFQRIGFLVTAVSIIFTVVAQLPAAAASVSGNGFTVSPVRTDLPIKPGESGKVTVYITNITKSPEYLQAVINDFTATQDESGTPALNFSGQNAPQHSLKQYASVDLPKFTLAPGKQQQVVVTITVPTSAKAGGYFGALRFAPQGVDTTKNVSLSASVASLILVTVPGNVKEQLSIVSFNATNKAGDVQTVFTSGKSVQAVVRFKNTGDLQEEPFGKVNLKRGSKVLASYEINNTTPRGNVLPDSIRKFSVPLDKVGSFGKYTLQGDFGYGTNGQLLTASTTFYVIPLGLIVGGAVAIVLILLAAFGLPRLLKAHDKRVLHNAGRR